MKNSELTICEMLAGLDSEILLDFEALGRKVLYPPGATLFAAGDACSGIFLITSGEVTLSNSGDAPAFVISEIARPGAILGLKAALCEEPYGITARTEQPCEVTFVNQTDLSDFLRRHPYATFLIVQRLSDRLHIALDQLRTALAIDPQPRPN